MPSLSSSVRLFPPTSWQTSSAVHGVPGWWTKEIVQRFVFPFVFVFSFFLWEFGVLIFSLYYVFLVSL